MYSSGVSEGTGREKRGRLLPCWTRGPTRDRKSTANGNRWNTRESQTSRTWCLVTRTRVSLELKSEVVNGW
eukprot:scaffold1052_cov339-Pavlova_lutheri.AAC.15